MSETSEVAKAAERCLKTIDGVHCGCLTAPGRILLSADVIAVCKAYLALSRRDPLIAPARSQPAEQGQEGKPELTKADPAGWYECRWIPGEDEDARYVIWWNGESVCENQQDYNSGIVMSEHDNFVRLIPSPPESNPNDRPTHPRRNHSDSRLAARTATEDRRGR